MKGRVLACAGLVCLLSAACAGGERSDRERRRAASWVASARLAAERWRAHTLSTVFAREVAGRAAEEVRGARGSLPAEVRPAAEEAGRELAALRAELGRRDDAAVAARDAALARAEAALRGPS